MSFDRRYMDLTHTISKWSHDPSTKVGAVIVNDNKIIGTGYNGLPKNVHGEGILDNRELKYESVIHAELNAILNSSQIVSGSTLYCTHKPCSRCTACIINAGISNVYYPYVNEDDDMRKRFKENFDIADMLIRKSNTTKFQEVT